MNRKTTMLANVRGFTLIEVLMAVVIVGILASVALRSIQQGVENSRIRGTQTEMEELVQAIAGNPGLYANGFRSDFGYVGDVGALPASLDNLVTNPGSYSTWDGPYIGGRFSEDTDGYKKDSWGNTYSFTGGITIASTGGGSTPLTTSVATAAGDLTSTPVVGTITDAGGNPPGDSSVAVSVKITYPDGTGGTTNTTVNPSSGGAFSFTGIPVGIRTVEAVYRATNDTVLSYAAVLPKTGATLTMRLPDAPFAASGGGGGGGSASIEYVVGSATTSGAQNDNVQFSIINNGTASATISSLKATYAGGGYFRYILWASTTVFNENFPRAGSGDVCNFTSSQIITAGETVQIDLQSFKWTAWGGPSQNMTGVSFSILFSDGSSVSFST